jgi:SNF2 family DNA or RNA helicase
MKCLQLANGAAYTDDSGTWEAVHDAKLEALDSVIEEANGASVLVAYHFKSDLARLQKRYPHGRVLDAKSNVIRDWNAGRVPLLFAHPASAGHGLNLAEGGNILAFFSLSWNLEEHMQIIERIGPMRQKQAGLNRPVFLHYLMARNTVDGMILERLSSKKSTQEILLEAMKERKRG